MSNKVNFQTYLYLNHNQFIIYVAEILTNEKIYSEKITIEENSKELKFNKLDQFLEGEIFDELIENLMLRSQEEELKNLS